MANNVYVSDSGAQGGIPSVPIEQPRQIFRFGEQTLWSSYLFAGASSIANGQFKLFSVAQGMGGQGYTSALSMAETNILEPGRVPSGLAYDVYGVACQFMQSSSTGDNSSFATPVDEDVTIGNLINFQNNAVLSWVFTQTQIDICPLTLAGAGGGAFGAVAAATTVAATTANTGNMNNGNGSVWVYRKHPVALPGNTTFGIQLKVGSRAPVIGTNSCSVRVVLLGFYKNIIEVG